MTEAIYKKLDIAVEYLDNAMKLYVEHQYFSALHLAAAAEELFGKHLPEDKRISHAGLKAEIAFRGISKGLKYEIAQRTERKSAWEIISHSKNSTKHMNDNGGDSTVVIDAARKARQWIEWALINFNELELKSDNLKNYWKFIDHSKSLSAPITIKRNPH